MTVTKKNAEVYDIILDNNELGAVENLDIEIGSPYCKKVRDEMYRLINKDSAVINLSIENATVTALELAELTRWVNGLISYNNVSIRTFEGDGEKKILTLNHLISRATKVKFFDTKIEELYPIYSYSLGIIDLTEGLTIDKINYSKFRIVSYCKMLVLPEIKKHYTKQINDAPALDRRNDMFVLVINKYDAQNKKKSIFKEKIKTAINLVDSNNIKIIFN